MPVQKTAQFDRFDICEAWYMYATRWHGGQGSKLYQVFGRLHNMQFRPAPGLSLHSLTPNGRKIYGQLVATKALQ